MKEEIFMLISSTRKSEQADDNLYVSFLIRAEGMNMWQLLHKFQFVQQSFAINQQGRERSERGNIFQETLHHADTVREAFCSVNWT